ncbi:MAG: N-6 DNA methylase [Candidatus Moraniibacteriota bacterium]|nr:MAG: N-6 DNA methylase [Candidatus Moranbacteria bacterium]
MLDQVTKRKLDSARQILVGKVPDPKAQVEQITTALVYKFMDDMDKESEELGGEAKFFANGFSQYAWTKLLDNRLSGQERLDLYVQAITNMSKNPHIPQLFRDIFKGAFLPYNDSRTLSLFLKEINEFNYEHSENLGNAFEYLLSILGSQGDAGQFRTPRHIIDFIVEVVDPKKNETILDPACGTAGFLISAYKHILKTNKEKPLTPDEKLKLMNNLSGYDISPDMVKLALVNMYLHGFPEPKIHEYDTLSSEKRWDETFDVIMANPPFMTPKGGIVPHKRFSIQANRAEVLFVDYIVEHLTIKGRAGIIVPEGIIFQSNNAYTQLRKKLIEDGLFSVVSLPAGVFNPYAGVKTSILLFDNEISKKTKNFLFVKIQNDGFDLGAQRREHNKNDLPLALEVIKKYKSSLDDKKFSEDEKQIAHIVSKEKIIAAGDYNLSGERYKTVLSYSNVKWPLVKLGDTVIDMKDGGTPSRRKPEYFGGDICWCVVKDIKSEIFDTTEKLTKLGLENSSAKVWPVGSIIISLGATIGNVGIAKVPTATKQGLSGIVVDKNKILPEFLARILENKKEYIQSLATGVTIKEVRPSKLKELFIFPLPPIEVQKEIVEQIEKYQHIIDSAKQIISNYKPTIKVDPSWQIIELGNLFLDTKLGLVKDKSMQADVFPYPYIKMDNITIDGNLELDSVAHVEASKEELEKYILSDGDFIYNTRNAPNLVGKSTVYHGEDGKYLFNNNILRIRFRKETDPDYVNYYLNTEEGKQKIKTLVSGTTSVAAIYQKNFATITVPLPPIEVQKEIVDEISKEKECVSASAKTIDIFEKKISQLINDIL